MPDTLSPEMAEFLSKYPCGIPAQADIFGMGIRISLYLQWYTTVLAYLYDPELATESTAVNYCFSIAVAICSLAYRKTIHKHEVIIIAMMLLVPPMIIVVALLDNLVSVFRSPKSSHSSEGGPDAEKPDPSALIQAQVNANAPVDPNIPGGPVGTQQPPQVGHSAAVKWLRDITVVVSTTFLLIVSVWEFFDGVELAAPVDKCDARFIYSHYLAGRYERFLKTLSIASAVITPTALIFLIYLQRTPEAEVAQEPEEAASVAPEPKKGWRGRLVSIESRYSPFRSGSDVMDPIKVRNVVALVWGAMISFVIAQTETIIHQNKLQGVLNPLLVGQLIPLTIGVCQFGWVTHATWVKGALAAANTSTSNAEHDKQHKVRNLQDDFRRFCAWVKRRFVAQRGSGTVA